VTRRDAGFHRVRVTRPPGSGYDASRPRVTRLSFASARMSRIPDLPGIPVPHRSEKEKWFKQMVARLCQLENERFPGSQPVSFAVDDLQKLDTKDYWVCEKSDGVRVLLFIYKDTQTNDQMVFLVRAWLQAPGYP